MKTLLPRQDETLARLEDFLGIPLARVVMRQDTINRWQRDDGLNYFDFFEPAMREYNYEIPQKSADAVEGTDPQCLRAAVNRQQFGVQA